MSRRLLGFALAAAIATCALPARASDASRSGFYMGVNAGVSGASTEVTPQTAGASSFNVSMAGGTAGAMIGYLHQAGRISFGIEGELSSMDVSGDETTQVGGSRTKTEIQLDRGARVRVRVGAGLGSKWLVYGAAGLSQAQSKMTLTSLSTPGQTASASERLAGGNFGIGGEYAFTRHLSGRVEWIYDIYGGTTYKTSSNPFFVDRKIDDLVAFTLRAALSLKF